MNKKLLESFEANFLDGDSIDDCGGAKFTAYGAYDVYEFAYEQGRVETVEKVNKVLKAHVWEIYNLIPADSARAVNEVFVLIKHALDQLPDKEEG